MNNLIIKKNKIEQKAKEKLYFDLAKRYKKFEIKKQTKT